MLLAMAMSAVLCVTIGIFPGWLYALLPFDTGYNPYDATHVLTQTQLLFFSALAFVWLNLKGLYPPELHSVNLDAEWLYRRFFPSIVGNTFARIRHHDAELRSKMMGKFYDFTHYLEQLYYPTSKSSQIRPTGYMVMWVAVLLAVYLWLLLSFVD